MLSLVTTDTGHQAWQLASYTGVFSLHRVIILSSLLLWSSILLGYHGSDRDVAKGQLTLASLASQDR